MIDQKDTSRFIVDADCADQRRIKKKRSGNASTWRSNLAEQAYGVNLFDTAPEWM
jgi:hypothetical protein